MSADSKSPDRSTERLSGWYKRAFADDYLFVYAHRSQEEARLQVAVAVRHLRFKPGQSVLDIACGNGRHMLAFAQRGARVTGVDLSPVLLKEARANFKGSGYPASLSRADMRELPYCERFDGATIWFTSLGYFATQADDLKVLRSMANALKPGGWWWIDLPNPAHLIRNLVPESSRVATGKNGKAEIRESRRIVGNKVVKRITISDNKGKRSYRERVRLYTPEQFGSIVKRANLVADGVLGDYDGSALATSRPRQIWYGIKPRL